MLNGGKKLMGELKMIHNSRKDCEKYLGEGNSLSWRYYLFGKAVENIINEKGERWFHTKNFMKNHWFVTFSLVCTILSFIRTGIWLWSFI